MHSDVSELDRRIREHTTKTTDWYRTILAERKTETLAALDALTAATADGTVTERDRQRARAAARALLARLRELEPPNDDLDPSLTGFDSAHTDRDSTRSDEKSTTAGDRGA